MGTDAAGVAVWRDKVRGTEPPQHGTAHAYNAYRCRCAACRAAAASKQRATYARRRARYLAERGSGDAL